MNLSASPTNCMRVSKRGFSLVPGAGLGGGSLPHTCLHSSSRVGIFFCDEASAASSLRPVSIMWIW